MDNTYAVIMAGGRGERFWPMSTEAHPKQLLALVGDKPMLAMTVEYVKSFIPPERILVITRRDLVPVTRRAVPELPEQNVIGEPVGRDTAAACALGSALVKSRSPKGAVCILTADHVIRDLDAFEATLRNGVRCALENDVLITIGMRPTFASTGFGYIETGERMEVEGDVEFFHTRRFVEKPDVRTAEAYVANGGYYWNSGMFIWSVAAFQKALRLYCPSLLRMAEAMELVAWTGSFDQCLADQYAALEKISVDYAIMEKADNILMAKGVFEWDDVGSWPALANHIDSDASGNVVMGDCESLEARDNVVVSKDRLTALIGVSDLVVVHAENVTLICPKDRAQDVRRMVQQVRAAGKYDSLL